MLLCYLIRFFIISSGLVLVGTFPAAADSYSFDTEHSHLVFTYNHLALSTQHARFAGFERSVVFDAENLANSSVEDSIDPAGVVGALEILRID